MISSVGPSSQSESFDLCSTAGQFLDCTVQLDDWSLSTEKRRTLSQVIPVTQALIKMFSEDIIMLYRFWDDDEKDERQDD